MKNLIHTFFTLTTIAVLSAASCKKNNPPPPDNPYGLPDATQTGRNMFACRINGENWVSDNGISAMGAVIAGNTLGIVGSNGGNNYFERITINIYEDGQEGKIYSLDRPGINSLRISTNRSCEGYLGGNVLNLFGSTGIIQISKLDITNKIISGTFSCSLPFPNCDTLIITDGRFDMKYR